MINFKTTNFDGFFSVEKPAGKHISLKIGEILKAEIMDILPSGGITLKIRGSVITTKSSLAQPLKMGAMAFLKVTGQHSEGREQLLEILAFVYKMTKEVPIAVKLPHQFKQFVIVHGIFQLKYTHPGLKPLVILDLKPYVPE